MIVVKLLINQYEPAHYRIVKKGKLMCAGTDAHTLQSLCCWHTQSIAVYNDEGSLRLKIRFLAPLDTSAWAFKEDFCACMISTKNSKCAACADLK